MPERTASCTCGQLQITVRGDLLGAGLCHCLNCQRRTGSVFATLAGFAAPYLVTGTATSYACAGDQGSVAVFRFCPVCGSTVFHTHAGYEDRFVNVAVGAFADPGFPPPQDSVYDCRRHPWVQLPKGMQVWDKNPD